MTIPWVSKRKDCGVSSSKPGQCGASSVTLMRTAHYCIILCKLSCHFYFLGRSQLRKRRLRHRQTCRGRHAWSTDALSRNYIFSLSFSLLTNTNRYLLLISLLCRKISHHLSRIYKMIPLISKSVSHPVYSDWCIRLSWKFKFVVSCLSAHLSCFLVTLGQQICFLQSFHVSSISAPDVACLSVHLSYFFSGGVQIEKRPNILTTIATSLRTYPTPPLPSPHWRRHLAAPGDRPHHVPFYLHGGGGGESWDFFNPWGRWRVLILKGRAYVKLCTRPTRSSKSQICSNVDMTKLTKSDLWHVFFLPE
jgi:hypothetical protein